MRQPAAPPLRTALYRELVRVTSGMAGRDAALAMVSLGFARAEMQQAALRSSGAGKEVLVPGELCDHRQRHAAALCATRAKSLDGHRARALAFCIWDDGELARRAADGGFLEDRLLWAVLSDLARA